MLTSAGTGTGIQFALNHAFKIAPNVVPQRRPLEVSAADAPGPSRNGATRDAGRLVVRGEPGLSQPWRRGSRNTGCGAGRAFPSLTGGATR